MSAVLAFACFVAGAGAGALCWTRLKRQALLLEQGLWALRRWQVLSESGTLSTRQLFADAAKDVRCAELSFLPKLEEGFSAENPNVVWTRQLDAFCREKGLSAAGWDGMRLALSRLGRLERTQQLALLTQAAALEKQSLESAQEALARRGRLSAILGALLGAGVGILLL